MNEVTHRRSRRGIVLSVAFGAALLSTVSGCGTSRFAAAPRDRGLGEEAGLYAYHLRSHGQAPSLTVWHLRNRRTFSETWTQYARALRSHRSGLSVALGDFFSVMVGPYSFDEMRETLDQL